MISNIVYASFLLVIVTKLMDIHSTLKYLGPKQERNPVVQWLLLKVGLSFRTCILLIVVLYYALMVFSYFSLKDSVLEKNLYSVLVILECLIISYFQVGAYYLNARGKIFPGMRFLLNTSWYSKF